MMRIFTALILGGISLTAFAGGNVTVSAKYEGTVPTFKPIDMGLDNICSEHYQGKEPLLSEALVLGEGQMMANVLVAVSSGLPAGQTYPLPTEPVLLTQQGCRYSPRVFGVRAGQPLKIHNPDGTLHNVNAQPRVNTPFNRGMPGNVQEIEVTFDKVEPMFTFACNVHPWMFAYCTVLDHPFFAVTDTTGVATLADLPAGEYEITATHEKLGAQTVKVIVAEGKTAELAFTFARSAR